MGGFAVLEFAPISLTKPFRKERCCLDSSILFWKGFVRLTGAILKQSNSTVQIRPPPWLNLQRKPELDLLPLELDFIYGSPQYYVAHRNGADVEAAAFAPLARAAPTVSAIRASVSPGAAATAIAPTTRVAVRSVVTAPISPSLGPNGPCIMDVRNLFRILDILPLVRNWD